MTSLLLLMAGLLGMAAPDSTDFTRGIGRYPGDKAEYFAPAVTWTQGQQLSNAALHSAAYASSTYDYNHTAHLVTDGLCDNAEPALLQVSTPSGPLPRREAEWAFDGGPFSRTILMGQHTWLQLDWNGRQSLPVRQVRLQGMVAYDDKLATHGYTILCQMSDDGQQWYTVGELKGDGLPGQPLHYKLHSDPNKQEAQEYLPARRLDETITLISSSQLSSSLLQSSTPTILISPTLLTSPPLLNKHFRLVMEMDGAAHWDVHELQLLDTDYEPVEMLSSSTFSSMWVSRDGGEQWIYTDLGRSLPIGQIRLQWALPPVKGVVQTSDDARQWQTVAALKGTADNNTAEVVSMDAQARYVRLLLQEAGPAGRYALREMEVLSKWQKQYVPHATPAVKDGRQMLSGGQWRLQRASEVVARGEEIASAQFDCDDWIPATVPGTVLASYLNIGAVPDPNYADNVDQISESFFRSNFWYRNEFEVADLPDGPQQWLHFDGINWKARVFLNGQCLGRIDGAFMRGRFNVTGLLRKGTNCLAVEIICNEHFAAVKEKNENTTQFNGGLLGADNPTFHATVGWDWITTVRGREAGIWNEVYLTTTGSVTLTDPYVQTEIRSGNKEVRVTPSVFVRNNDSHAVSGTLSGWMGEVRFEKQVTLPAQTEQQITFSPEQFAQLTGSGFHLWWPNGYGEPYLYEAGFCFKPNQKSTADCPTEIHYKAGLRQMEYVDAKDSLRIYVNGQRFVPLGGNWGFDEHNLLYRTREYDIAVGYHRDMNFTMIRNWVGQVADEAFYEACDRYGIMVWQDFWLANPADGPDPYDNRMFLSNAEDYVRRIRSHACIGLYCGRNEGFPPESLDRPLRQYVHALSPGLEYISHSSSQGVSGGGPYRALPMKEYFSRQSGKIHSERGMPNIMNLESLRRTMSPEGIWPQSVEWGQHDFTLQGAQRAAEFNLLMDKAFGPSTSIEDFSRRAQLINYNGYRGMFEATSKSRAGLLLWMSHPCWPSMVWQTYDYFFEPTAAYFGAKKACEPIHIQYNALTDSIEVVVLHQTPVGRPLSALTATATVYDLNGRRTHQKKARLKVSADSTLPWTRLADVMPKAPAEVYFLRLQLTDKQGVVSENLYIMGREENNVQALTSLPKPEVDRQVSFSTDGDTQKAEVTLRNTGKTPAVFLRLNLKGTDGEQILPACYSDNYLTLMPGETRKVTVTWRREDARGQKAMIEVTPL